MNTDISSRKNLLLVRYQYLLDQRKNLAENTFKVLATYQALILAIGAMQLAISGKAVDGGLESHMIEFAVYAVYFLHLFVSLTCVVLLVSGILSWIGYKHEELRIEVELSGEDFVSSNGTSYWGFLKWYETYLIAAVVAANIFHLLMVPLLMSIPYQAS